MKRKIEAKMREQSSSSHATLEQEIVISILDKNEESPATTPSIQSPKTLRDAWGSTIDNPSSNTPVSGFDSTGSKETVNPMLDKNMLTLGVHIEDQQKTEALDIYRSMDATQIPELITNVATAEDDEEARLLAELEAERLAEEKARQKRRELESRLANARGKKNPTANQYDTRKEERWSPRKCYYFYAR